MKVFTLKSFASTKEGTFGVLFEPNKEGELLPFCLTLERRWLNNEKGKSCIPRPSENLCKRVLSPHFGDTFEVICPPREKVLCHKGNLDDDSHGCIILGEMYAMIYDKMWGGFSPGLAASGAGFGEFMQKLKGEQEFKLVIQEV